MSVDKETVLRVARLARIAISDEAATGLQKDMSSILDWVAQLDEVDTNNVAPMTSAVHVELKRREDAVTDGNRLDDVLKNAPQAEDGFYTVPKVVE